MPTALDPFARAKKLRDRSKPSVNLINAAVDAASCRMLVLSTAHIPEGLVTGEAPAIARIAAAVGDHGWLVAATHTEHYLLSTLSGAGDARTRQAVVDLLRFAATRGFAYVLFDADGEELPQFHVYNW